MTSIIKFQAFSGAQDESPPCYLLQVDEFRFLLDCGWDENFNMKFIDNIKKYIHQIDAVLLSYPDPIHIGALPYLVGKCGLHCPVYATAPVYKMGQMFMYDLFQSWHNNEDFTLFTLDDVDAAFDKIQQLKYSQTVSLKGKGHGLQITPLPAGHMIGGTIWKITKEGEEEIVYMTEYNFKKERHLNGCCLEGLSKPHLLITDALNAEYTHARRRTRDEQLMTEIVQTMRNDGNVLICIDTAGRVLELAQLLDTMWRTAEAGLMAYSLALLNNVSYNVMEFAKSQVEWMSEKLIKSFEDQRSNPFQFKHLQLCHSFAELQRLPPPKVVLASVPDLQCGYSRELFLQWCGEPKNTIILTTRTSPPTLGRQLIENPGIKTIQLEVKRRVRLEGEELEEYLRLQKEQEEEEARLKALQAKQNDMDSSDESEEDDDIDMGQGLQKHDIMLNQTGEGKIKIGFFKQTKKAYPMYPCIEDHPKYDEYGELIRPEDFMLLDGFGTESDNANKNDTRQAEKLLKEHPTKCISLPITITLNAKLMFIDFEGRTEKESMRKIITQLKPRQLILIRGNKKATDSLAQFCRSCKEAIPGKVFTPKINEVVDATTESHIYQVKLLDSVVSALQFSKAREAELAWIDAQLEMTAEEDSKDLVTRKDGDANRDIIPTLVPLPAGEIRGHKAVFVNEPRLSDFKQLLHREGIMAEFSAGVLICGNTVAIRKTEAGKLQLEGCIGDMYFKVRDLLYQQYAIV